MTTIVCSSWASAYTRLATGQETIFACMQLIEPRVLARIPPDRFITTTTDVYPALLSTRGRICYRIWLLDH